MSKTIGTLREIGARPGDRVADAMDWEADVVFYNDRLCVLYPNWEAPEERNEHAGYRIISRAAQPDTPKLWRDMTPEEKGALLLAHHEGKEVQGTRIDIPDDWQCMAIGLSDYAYRIKPQEPREFWLGYNLQAYSYRLAAAQSFGTRDEFVIHVREVLK